jgi:hypothetical protein
MGHKVSEKINVFILGLPLSGSSCGSNTNEHFGLTYSSSFWKSKLHKSGLNKRLHLNGRHEESMSDTFAIRKETEASDLVVTSNERSYIRKGGSWIHIFPVLVFPGVEERRFVVWNGGFLSCLSFHSWNSRTAHSISMQKNRDWKVIAG